MYTDSDDYLHLCCGVSTLTSSFDSKEHYEKLFNMSLDMMCLASLDGYFKKVNPAFMKTLGYSEKELLSRSFLEFVHEDDIQITELEMEKLQKGRNSFDFENRYRHQDGSYRVLSWSGSVDMESGAVYAVARDVTKSREADNHFVQLMDALHKESIMAVTDADGTIIEVNDKFCEISGYSKDELIGQNHRIVNSGRHPKEFFEDMWRTISSGKPWSGMIENRRKDGEHYFVQSIIAPVFDIEGSICNYIAIRFDSTQHVQVKLELERTLEILNETGSIAKVGGWELEVATGDLTWTEETFNILEVEKREDRKPVLPEGLELFTDEFKPVIEQAVSRAIEFGEPYSLELEARTAKGNVLWVYTNGKANYVDGKVVTLSGTIQDIHQRKLAEQKYEDERMKSIQNAKLASLGELAAGIAHEINNPLAHISGSAQIMSKFIDNPEKIAPMIDGVEKSCNRISRIVKSLRKFSRTNEQQAMDWRRLSDLVEESLILTHAKSLRENVKISFNHQSATLIYCDEVEIEQVVVNLVNNAIDAVKTHEDKWVQLSVCDDGGWVEFRITDSGSGISPELLPRLFDPFFTTKRVGEGTGLGLSITRGILEDHGAEFFVDETSNNTSFVVRFPGQGNDGH